MKKLLLVMLSALFVSVPALAQTAASTGSISGTVKDPNQAVLTNTQVVLTNLSTTTKIATATNERGIYVFPELPPGVYSVAVEAKGLQPKASSDLKLAAGQSLHFDISVQLAGNTETVHVSAGTVENAYRVEHVTPGGPFGTTPILDLPYSINVISRQLIDDTQSRNFKEAAKYLPLVSFQEMQGPEVLRPQTRGFQGSNMQNDRKDGMGIAVTTPSALEEYEQLEVVNGLGGSMFGPANPSGIFNFVTKRPTEAPLREVELQYEGSTVATGHVDLGGRLGKNQMFGYRTNLVLGDGAGYVTDSQLRRQLAAVALDVRPFSHTVIEGNFSYYNLFQHGYPGWFGYAPTTTAPYVTGSKSILLPVNAPDPTRRGYGQSFSGVDLNNQIGELRVKHDLGANWHLIAGVLHQIANRNINTAVNSFTNNAGNYQTYLANEFSSLAPRFQVNSDLGYITGSFKTWNIGHDVVIGSTGYRFASWSPKTTPAKVALCPAGLTTCAPSISTPLVDVPPPATGLLSYSGSSPYTHGLYVSSVLHQQGFNLADTISLTPRFLLRVAASQDWYWTNNYTTTGSPNYSFKPNTTLNFSTQGVSPTASLIFKPAAHMTIYGTFADSLQAPDSPVLSTATVIIVNSAKALAPYRSTEGEVGYKLESHRINFSTAMFRMQRPFANTVADPNSSDCGTLKTGQVCDINKIVGDQINYGVEGMLSGRVVESLMVTGGLTVLDARLTGTGNGATENMHFVGIPDYKSNILAEYRIPVLTGAFFNFDWQHVGRRAVDDINSTYTHQFNTFDIGARYTAKVFGKVTTWRVTANNVTDVHYWSTLGPGSITGQSSGSYLGHLGEPRLVTASMRYNF
ncbi:MAG: TonB-dependent receptor [Terracidiphilus sp.]|nr:TonB-dependent receptor [Terracidiphilus sp.]MDR3776140.1 TonB-dependent receptor [Terracidiphilus sp.]